MQDKQSNTSNDHIPADETDSRTDRQYKHNSNTNAVIAEDTQFSKIRSDKSKSDQHEGSKVSADKVKASKIKAGKAEVNKVKALLEVLTVSFKLGLTSFGGPAAHLAYFHNEYVQRRKWMDERSYADLVALCQFLPGPASSQVGMGIGIMRAGLFGGVLAWLGFTLPSVIALLVFAMLLQNGGISSAGWLHGLKLVAVAIVAQAVLTMGQKLAVGRIRASIAIAAASIVLLWQTAFAQFTVILLAALAGLLLRRQAPTVLTTMMPISISRRMAMSSLLLFAVLLLALPLASHYADWAWLSLFDSFYRVGSLVFGGGHVVLPLLQGEVVGNEAIGTISEEIFLAGYGAVQAVPGPLFTIAAYLGWFAQGLLGVLLATVAIFLPSFLLVVGALPFWNSLRGHGAVQAALTGVNAAVIGILLAALYDPIWKTVVVSSLDFVVASLLFVMLHFWKLPSWIVVIAGAAAGMFII